QRLLAGVRFLLCNQRFSSKGDVRCNPGIGRRGIGFRQRTDTDPVEWNLEHAGFSKATAGSAGVVREQVRTRMITAALQSSREDSWCEAETRIKLFWWDLEQKH